MDEAERYALGLILDGQALPSAEEFGAMYGKKPTWGGDRLRAARRMADSVPTLGPETMEMELRGILEGGAER